MSANQDDIIQIDEVFKSFGKCKALQGVSTTVRRGEVLVIIGPSGSGKSTLLRCINMLEHPNSGNIIVDGISVMSKDTDINVVREEVGIVFQQFNLFPHLTVIENVMLAQRIVRKRKREEAKQIAEQQLKYVGIPEKADAFPHELSGGQQQRVAIARALAMNAKTMLFGEAHPRPH